MVLEGVTSKMEIVQHETFGPVMTLQRASDEEDAIRMANDSYLGLSASVWSTCHRRAMRVARQIEAGSVGINDHLMPHGMAETPWGGYKESSVGKTHGRLGLEGMTKAKVIIANRFARAPQELWWMPNGQKEHEALSNILRFLYGPGRLRAAGKLLPAFLSGLARSPKLKG
jgi:succinate-semialdehyde dehydrogenase/glutarate-semialdehyde dehydrogenase